MASGHYPGGGAFSHFDNIFFGMVIVSIYQKNYPVDWLAHSQLLSCRFQIRQLSILAFFSHFFSISLVQVDTYKCYDTI